MTNSIGCSSGFGGQEIQIRLQTDLVEKIDHLDPGKHSIVFGDQVFFVSKISKTDPICLGIVNLAEKAFAKGGFGKVYEVQSIDPSLEVVFKLSRKRLKSRGEDGELIPLTKEEKELRAKQGSRRGLVAKNDLIQEYELMQFIKNHASSTVGVACDAFAIVNYHHQVGIFIKKFDFDGMAFVLTKPNIKDRVAILENLFEGLATLHELNIYHRDIKLENILIKGREGFISDFGTACKKEMLFTEEKPYPKFSDIIGKGTAGTTSALIVQKIKTELRELEKFEFGSKEYQETSSEIFFLLKSSDLFSMSVLAYMFCTGRNPPFQSFEEESYLRFDQALTAEEQNELKDKMCEDVYMAIKPLFKDKDAIKNTTQIMKFFVFGLNFKDEG